MSVYQASFVIKTRKAIDIRKITKKVKRILKKSRLKAGVVTVFVKHTTAAIRINEWESGFLKDLRELLERLIPQKDHYGHNELSCRDPATMCGEEECLNGHSHLQQIFAGNTSESIPFVDGELQLGRWQEILLLELSDPREREIFVTVIGE